MKVSTLFVLCTLVAAALAQTLSIRAPALTGNTVTVGVQSDWFFIETSSFFTAPNTSTTVSISEGTGNVDLSATSLSFNPNVQQLSFRVTPKTTGLLVLEFSVSNTVDFSIPATYSINSVSRVITTDYAISVPSTVYVNRWTDPIKIYFDNPSTTTLSLTPTLTTTPANMFQIYPTTISIPAGGLSASFRLMGTQEFSGILSIDWGTIGGDVNDWYDISNLAIGFTVARRPTLVAPTFSASTLVLGQSSPLYFYTAGDRPNASLTVTPQAADTTFSPASVTLDPNTQVAQFTVTTTSTEPNKPVFFYTSAEASGYFNRLSYGTLNTPKRSFIVNSPTLFAVTKPSKISIKIEQPATNGVTVSLYAANMVFDPSEVTFTGAITGMDVEVTPTNTGADTISFKISGQDAAYYNDISDYYATIEGGTITGPASWYIPALWVGQESDRLPIRLNFAPDTEVIVTPMAADLIFTPANLTFTPDDVEQYFTITPVLANNNYATRSTSISFAVSGADWSWYTAPAATTTITVNQRILQATWSSDLELGETSTLYVGVDYTVWVSTNYVGNEDEFTVTPVSNYFKFNPEVLTFNSGTWRASFVATPLAGVRSASSARINYIVSGNAAGYYQELTQDQLPIALRPLYFYSAVVSRDDRVDAWRYVNASNYGSLLSSHANITSAFTANHLQSFSIATPAFPWGKLTITPKCAHISFSPSSVTLTSSSKTTIWVQSAVSLPNVQSSSFTDTTGWEPTYLAIANFTVNGHAPGTHEVYFELSGSDAYAYITPPHVGVTIRKYTGGGSGSSTVVASIGMIVASIVLALFL